MAEEFSYRNYFEYESKIIAMYGGTLPDSITVVSQKNFKTLWILIIILFVLSINIFAGGYLLIHITSLSDIVDGCTIFGTFLSTTKLYYTVSKRKGIAQVYTTIFTEEDFLPKNEQEEAIAVEAFQVYRILKHVFTIAVEIGIVLCIFTNAEKTQYLPLTSWYPFDVWMSPFYEIAFIHQCVVLVILAKAAIMSEIAMIGFTSFIALQCDLICHRLENLKCDDHRKLIEIIEVHKKVLSFVEKLETTFGSAYFGQFLVVIIILAMSLFALEQEKTWSFQIILLLSYVSIMYLLLLLPCWFTSELTRRSELISETAFKCSWVESSNSFKKDLMYFMQISQKPMTISIFGFFPISLGTALKVMQTSFSYYTMLNKLNK